MIRVKKIVSICLAVSVLTGMFVLCSCSTRNSIFKIGEYDVSYSLYRYVVMNAKNDIKELYGDDVWNSDNSKAAVEECKETVREALLEYFTKREVAKEFGLSGDSELIKSEVNDYYNYLLDQYEETNEFYNDLTDHYMTKDVFIFLAESECLSDESYAYLKENDKLVSNEEDFLEFVRGDSFIRVKQILIGGENAGTDEENLETIEKIYDRLSAGEDFDVLCNEKNNDLVMFKNDNGYYIMEGTRDKEFEKAAFSLKIGEISEIVKTNAGYSIIKRYEKDDEYLKDHIDELMEEYIETKYSLMFEEKKEELAADFFFDSIDSKYDISNID